MINAHIHLDLQNEADTSGIVPSIGKQNWEVVATYKHFALGIHPWFVDSHSLEDINELERKITTLKTIAIGEIGLDFHKDINKNIQINFFKAQLRLAQKYNLPVIIHAVKSYDEIYNILKNYQLRVQIHAFNGSPLQGQKLLDIGCYLSFGLYKKSKKLQEFIRSIPLDKILIETDEQPNEHLIKVATEIADLKNIQRDEFVKITDTNANKLFNV